MKRKLNYTSTQARELRKVAVLRGLGPAERRRKNIPCNAQENEDYIEKETQPTNKI